MKILFYLAAGNGDLINFTGVLNLIKCKHPEYEIDFLVLKRQSYILENNPCIGKLLFFEDYKHIPQHCTSDNHDNTVISTFCNEYNFVFSVWGCKIKDPSMNNYDYADVMAKLINEYGFNITYSRREIIPTFYYSSNDYLKITDYSKLNNKIILVEDKCYSAQNLQAAHNESIYSYLRNSGYLLAGNGSNFDINISELNLKLAKLFFEMHCCGFLGLSSGMTCAIYSYPTLYVDKKVIISGQTPSWDFSKIVHGYKNYYYFNDHYDLQDIKSIL